MLKKFALAAATAGFVAMTGLAATATPAAADQMHDGYGRHHHQHRVCRPVVRYVKWVGRHGHVHWKKVTTMKCTFRWY
jgi:hypothetical protein